MARDTDGDRGYNAASTMPHPRHEPRDANALSDLVTRCILAFEQGGDAALDALLADNPALAEKARSQLLSLRDAGLLVPPLPEPEQIGPYRVLRSLGSGAVGSVYLAEQHEPIHRRVAIKVIRPGMDSREVLARFAVERQALALLDHPNVARVLDAGVTTDGRPYLCMEYVAGQPITHYCDERRLNPRQRIELLTQVCDAVHAAHQKGILHRDLKPSNILVSDRNGKPWPTVIDFGVAKSLGPRLLDVTLLTGHGRLVGTPEYMSPEQAANEVDVDTRTDVHALGVVLYELLTGSLPIPSKRLRGSDTALVLRTLQQEVGPLPSAAIAAQIAAAPKAAEVVAYNRSSSGSTLVRNLCGELDWIVQQSIEKDRNRRYGMASEMAADLRRFLRHELVLAGPQSLWYRWSKSLRRNRLQVGAGGAILVALLGGMSTSLAFHAEAADKAEQSEFNLGVALAAVERMVQAGGNDLNIVPHMEDVRRELLAEALKLQQLLVTNTNGTRLHLRTARVLVALGSVHSQLSQYEEAVALADEAQGLLTELRATELPPDRRAELQHLEVALAFSKAGWIESLGYPQERVRNLLREASQGARVMMATAPSTGQRILAARVCARYGEFLSSVDADAASRLFDEARAMLRPVLEAEHDGETLPAGALTVLAAHAKFYISIGNQELAVATATRLDEMLTKAMDGTPNAIERVPYAAAIEQLASIWYRADKFQRAVTALEPVIELRRSLMRDFPSISAHASGLGRALVNKAMAQAQLNGHAKTKTDLLEAQALFAQLLAEHPTVSHFHEQAAQVALHLVQHCILRAEFGLPLDSELANSAMASCQESLAVLTATKPRACLELRARAAALQGIIATSQKRPKQAMEAQREAVALYERLVRAEPKTVLLSSQLIDAKRLLAASLIRAGELIDAETLVSSALAANEAIVEQTGPLRETRSVQRELLSLKIQLGTADRNWAEVMQCIDEYLELAENRDTDWRGRKGMATAALHCARAATAAPMWRARFVARIRSILTPDMRPLPKERAAMPMVILMRSNSLRILVEAEQEFGEAMAAANVQREVVAGYKFVLEKSPTERGRARLAAATEKLSELLTAAGATNGR